MSAAATVPAESVWKAPDGVGLSKCANLGRNFFAAYHSLKIIGGVGAGDLVLVDGASGGVGMAAVTRVATWWWYSARLSRVP